MTGMGKSLKGWLVFLLMTSTYTWDFAGANDVGGPGVAVVKGNCFHLITGADNYTAQCAREIASVTLTDGTVMFIFTINGTPLAFSGNGKQATKGVGELARLAIDFVMLGETGSKAGLKAEGSCMFGNAFQGSAPVICMAQTERGPFVGAFQTDGSHPVKSPE